MKFLPDFLALSGLCLLGYGLYLFIPWVSFAVCGSLIIVAGVRLGASEKDGEA